MDACRALKEEGLVNYKNGEYGQAAVCWRQAVEMLDGSGENEGEQVPDWELERSLYLNLGMAHLKCREPREGIRALRCILLGGDDDPEVLLKTLYRMALCYKELRDWDEVERHAKAMLEVDPDSALARHLLDEAVVLRARDQSASTRLAKHMFSGVETWSDGRARRSDSPAPRSESACRWTVAREAAVAARERPRRERTRSPAEVSTADFRDKVLQRSRRYQRAAEKYKANAEELKMDRVKSLANDMPAL
ncbi:hypothetical protein FOL47_010654 [Perkinsus chesapeaki]|uniref:Uncharacterized protein n=1 Tax=Perkinsus chesapeaki TaxID=330153 RepID=A0A7J6L2W2_PERCH|nr:hypothetical protein FOL47_010654 [Perkinsus chesapeaki]